MKNPLLSIPVVMLLLISALTYAGAPLKGCDVKLGKAPGGSAAARITDNNGDLNYGTLPEGDYILTLNQETKSAFVVIDGAIGGQIKRSVDTKASARSSTINFTVDGNTVVQVTIQEQHNSEENYGQCYSQFKKYRRQLAMQSLLVDPLGLSTETATGVVVGGIVETVKIGDSVIKVAEFAAAEEFGELTALSGGLILGGAVTASVGTFFEVRSVTRWIETANTMRVIRDAYAGKLSDDKTAQKITQWTDSGALCDGSLKKRPPRNQKLKNLLPTPRELRRALKTMEN